MLVYKVDKNGEAIAPVKKLHKVEVLVDFIKRKDISSENFFMKLFFGEDLAKVKQRFKLTTNDSVIITDEIIDIQEDAFNSTHGQNYVDFICSDGTIYEIVFSVEDTEESLEDIYLWAQEGTKDYILGKMKGMKCYSALKQVCYIPKRYYV